MKYFIAIDEELLMKLWMLDPSLVAPYPEPRVKKKMPDPKVQALTMADKPESNHSFTQAQNT